MTYDEFFKEVIQLLTIIVGDNRFDENEYIYFEYPNMFGVLNADKIDSIQFDVSNGSLYIEHDSNINDKDVDLFINDNGCLIQNIY